MTCPQRTQIGWAMDSPSFQSDRHAVVLVNNLRPSTTTRRIRAYLQPLAVVLAIEANRKPAAMSIGEETRLRQRAITVMRGAVSPRRNRARRHLMLAASRNQRL